MIVFQINSTKNVQFTFSIQIPQKTYKSNFQFKLFLIYMKKNKRLNNEFF